MLQNAFEDMKRQLNIHKIVGVSFELKDFFSSQNGIKAFSITSDESKYLVSVRLKKFNLQNAMKVFTSFVSFMTYSKSGFYICNKLENIIEYQFITSTDDDAFQCNIIFKS